MAPPGVLPETYLQFFKEDIQALQRGYVLDLGALGTVWVHGGLGVATTDMPQGSNWSFSILGCSLYNPLSLSFPLRVLSLTYFPVGVCMCLCVFLHASLISLILSLCSIHVRQ
jgi:hypothetical protein